jgi:hypothetical protein
MLEERNDWCDECAWPEDCANRNGCQRAEKPMPHDSDPHPLEIASLAVSVFLLLTVNWENLLAIAPGLRAEGLLIGGVLLLASGLAVYLVRRVRGAQ